MADHVLELETRREIYDIIVKLPGLHMRGIQRKLKMTIALVEYHLNALEKAEIVTSIMEGGYKRYYIASESAKIDYMERRFLGVLRQKIPLQITLFLIKSKRATHGEISSYLNISPSKLSFHLKKLSKSGIIKKLERTEGKGYIVEDENKILRLLITHKPSLDMLDEFSELWDGLNLYWRK